MGPRVKDRDEMIRCMAPVLKEGRFAFETVPEGVALPAGTIATMREDEGLSVLRPARASDGMIMRQITLSVHSALDGVGLTAAVATALAEADIPANVVAGHHHDHVFVPEEQAEAAIDVLKRAATAPT